MFRDDAKKTMRDIPTNKKILFLVFLFFLPFFSSSAFAAHPLITDDAGTQGKGKFQLEINGEFNYDKESEAGVKSKITGGEVATTISYGIIDNVDIVLGIPYQWFKVKEDGEIISREKGLSDISLELKWRFYEREGWSFALKPGVTFPTGKEEKDLGAGRVTYGMFFITTKEIEPLAFHLNLGYKRNENKLDERKDTWHISLASEWKLIKDLKLVANIGLERNPDKTSNTPPAFILGGIIYSIVENFDIDIGIKGGLNKPETDLTILAGIAWRF
jgi:long-subunit fatty acid transport protein